MPRKQPPSATGNRFERGGGGGGGEGGKGGEWIRSVAGFIYVPTRSVAQRQPAESIAVIRTCAERGPEVGSVRENRETTAVTRENGGESFFLDRCRYSYPRGEYFTGTHSMRSSGLFFLFYYYFFVFICFV